MNIVISNSSGKPIYEQIAEQIKAMILNGELEPGAGVPSIRLLAKELRISVITTKRAYEELERDGFLVTVPGKGSFVAEKNLDFVREERLRQVEEYLQKAVACGKAIGLSQEEFWEILHVLLEEDVK
ncbi:GntR family transcriptional regulator [Hominifimenecus sp. rT4P-3]|uniref:GntR family transcriptional regulator n=1 Tax=Hominifimenecus sp. rT4P-3 TaxID=3242979 RepID=UPI003DA34BA7